MTLPSLLLAVILSTLFGAVFHLLMGGSSHRLLFYLVAGWLGFAVGHVAGDWFTVPFGAIGPLNAGSATLGSWLTLLLARWLLGSRSLNSDDAE
jgi:hypothetical protein